MSRLTCRPRRLRKPSSPSLYRTLYGKAILHIKKSSAYGGRLCTDSFLPRLFLIGDNTNQLPSNLGRWRIDEKEEQIWRCLDKVFRDAGFTLWTHAYFSVFRSPGQTYPLSSGFGYAIPTRIESNRIGTVGRLRQFQFPVC